MAPDSMADMITSRFRSRTATSSAGRRRTRSTDGRVARELARSAPKLLSAEINQAFLSRCHDHDRVVRRALGFEIVDMSRFMPSIIEQNSNLWWQVLVDEESHAGSRRRYMWTFVA